VTCFIRPDAYIVGVVEHQEPSAKAFLAQLTLNELLSVRLFPLYGRDLQLLTNL